MTAAHFLVGAGTDLAHPLVRRIQLHDLRDALAKAIDDFYAMPTHAMFLCVIYPVVGLLAARLAYGYAILPLLYPVASGFALIGPLAALGLCELSRRREGGLKISAASAFRVVESSSIGAIIALGILLFLIFIVWVAIANAIYVTNFGYAPPASIKIFIRDVLTTRSGWNLIVVGNSVGLLFAILAFSISVLAFPLLLDRDVGAAVAVGTSLRAVIKNPVVMAIWGLIISILLLIGSLPLFLGLTVVLPILGHATWHLYRKVVEPSPDHQLTYHNPPKQRRYAADFPVSMFPWAR